MKFLQALFSPLAILYGMGVSFRNALYDHKLVKGTSFSIPIISVGNLTVGGSGKTPHIEYLVRILQPYIDVSVLSRGYKRKSFGYKNVMTDDLVENVGDEPLQIKQKYPNVPVAVAENRSLAIPQLLYHSPDVKLVLLDDGYQHRAVNAGMHILLTEYSDPFFSDYLLPIGRLREWRHGYQRADIILVTKTHSGITENEKKSFISKINPLAHQRVFFTRFEYGLPYKLFDPTKSIALDQTMDVVVLSGIAKPEYLVQYLKSKVRKIHLLDFPDHHYFSNFDIAQLYKLFQQVENPNKIILTTEKDALRLKIHEKYLEENGAKIYVIPIEVAFLFGGEKLFESSIRDYLLSFKS